jgi:hypothetical protein
MMEAVYTSETPAFFNESTRRCIPEGCHIHALPRESLQSRKFIELCFFFLKENVIVHNIDS